MNSTVLAVFDEYGQAHSAMNALFTQGFAPSDVKLSPAESSAEARQAALHGAQQTEPGRGWSIGNFFRSLFGSDQHANDADLYTEAVRRGSYLISVTVANPEQGDRAAAILHGFNPVDLEQRATEWRKAGWGGAPATQTQNETQTSLPVIEEELKVGKRSVLKGGVRIYQHITERPVEESVRLTEEHVSVTRTPVNEPATEADLAAFKEGTMEVRETAEEPVVEKTARVVEEVNISKDVTERTETVSDTLRRTDVDVEKMSPQQVAQATQGTQAASTRMMDEDIYRQHFQTAYGGSGGRFEDYAPAYSYGATLAGNQRYQGYRWEELEPQVRSEWESTHAGSPWERTSQAIRYGWEKSRH